MARMKLDSTRNDLVTQRGPASGTGKALPDKDALAILDKRIKPNEQTRTPDIGVLINPGTPHELSQTWIPGSPSARLSDASLRSGAYGASRCMRFGSENPLWVREIFEPDVPEDIVIAEDITVPLGSVVVWPPSPRPLQEKPRGYILFMRVAHAGTLVDLFLGATDLDKPDRTLSELIEGFGSTPHRR